MLSAWLFSFPLERNTRGRKMFEIPAPEVLSSNAFDVAAARLNTHVEKALTAHILLLP